MATKDIDLDATITIARDDLRRLHDTIPELWALRYTRDWQPDSGRGAPGKRSQTLYDTANDKPFLLAYLHCCAEVGRASALLLTKTDVPCGWLPLRTDGLVTDPDKAIDEHRWGESRPVTCIRPVEPDVAQLACRIVSRMLEWARDQDLRPPEQAAVLEACDHAKAAYDAIPRPGRTCANECGRLREPGRTVCRRCRRVRLKAS